jgi:hypothetical protein
MLRVEFHCHTHYSRDSLVRPERLVAACRRKGIDRVVITDHNTIAGAQRCQQIDPQRVIIGEEILTKQGELLAAYVQEEVPEGLEPKDAIQRLRNQGAFISVSHPFDRMRKGHWELQELLEIMSLVDAIETFNARCYLPVFNSHAQKFAEMHALLGTVGSDAHALFELGRATLHLPDFNDAASLKASLPKAELELRQSSPWVHLASRWASWVKKLKGEG